MTRITALFSTVQRNRKTVIFVVGWIVLMAACYVLGNVAKHAGVPAPHLLVALVVGVVAALAGVVRGRLPKPVHRASQATVGVLMGSYLDPGAVAAVGHDLGPIAVITVATIVLCLAGALVLPRMALMPRADAILGMVPGGSAAIIACADELDADARVVAFMQYARVAVVAATAPLVVLAISSTPMPTPASPGDWSGWLLGPTTLVTSANPVAGLTLLVALCFLGTSFARRLGLPAPVLLGPMVLAGVGVLTGAAQGFAPDGLLQDFVFVAVGLEVGLRFSRDSVRQIGRSVVPVLASTIVLCGACAVLAAGLCAVTGIPYMDAYLATTPGGINAVLATAASMHSNVALISTAQSLRLFAVVLIVPPLIRRMAEGGPLIPRQPKAVPANA